MVIYRFEDVLKNKTGEDFQKASALFSNGKVVFVQPMLLGGDKIFVSKIIDNRQDFSVRLVFDSNGEYKSGYCTCGGTTGSSPCAHILAAALHCDSVYGVRAKKLREKETVGQYLKDYFDQHENTDNRTGGRIKLVPVLCVDYHSNLYIKLEIGESRMYEIRNPQEFYELAKSTPRSPSSEQKPDAVWQFALDAVSDYLDYKKSAPHHNGLTSSGAIYLSKTYVDKFFELVLGTTVKFIKSDSGKERGERLVTDEPPYLSLVINRAGSQYLLTSNLYDVDLLRGKEHLYLLGKNKITRLDKQKSAALETFLEMFTIVKQLTLNEEQMQEFFTSTLSKINNYLDISATDVSLDNLQPETLTAKIYLDLNDNNHITGSLNCFYNDSPLDIFKDEQQAVVRSLSDETALKDLIFKYFGLRQSTLYLSSEQGIFTLMSDGIDELTQRAEVFVTDKLKRIAIKKPGKINIGVKLEGDLFGISASSGEYTNEELIELLEAFKLKKKYTRLKSGMFIDTSGGSVKALSDILDSFDLSPKTLIDGSAQIYTHSAPYLDKLLKNADDVYFERDKHFKNIITSLTNVEDSDYEVPHDLKSSLRNYQKTGYRWLRTLCNYGFGGILADDMGLGKTLQMITLIKSMQQKGQKSIIVCPTSLILNWRNELSRWAPELNVACIFGNVAERERMIDSMNSYDILVTSYELLRNDISLYVRTEFLFAVIDEGQFIKNYNTQNARSVKMLKSKYRFAISGTPIENNLSELWSIFDFVMPKYLHSYSRFKQEFEIPIIRENSADALSKLHSLVKPFILRRLKTNVLKELPDKMESVLEATLEGSQKDVYHANLALVRQSLSASAGAGAANKITILSMLTKLRQVCCGPELIYQDYTGNNAKLDLCLELIETSIEGGHKVLLFSQFTSMMDIIEERLIQRGIKFYDLRGDTPKLERMRLIERFNTDTTPLFMLSLKSGGTGLNLTGADVVIHYDPWWNLSVQNQATDRAHRIGQNKVVQVYKLILADTIEERILKLQDRKKELSEMVIQEGETFLSSLSVDELMQLFD